MKHLGLYVHIPFCKSKCGYCDFNSYSQMEEYMPPYFGALQKEAEGYAGLGLGSFDTVYFGGGTPTYTDSALLCKALEELYSVFDILPNAEITVECNPKTIGFDGLKALKGSGINRLSIGLQSVFDERLKSLGRIHTFDDFKSCFEAAEKAGFDNISLDLMYGLPDMTLSEWERTLLEAADFGAEHISCYLLKIEEGTPFANMNLTLPDDDTVADMYGLAVDFLAEKGYQRYEISNFARLGKESRHNLKYWRCDDFLGLGAGAFSCLGERRFSNACGIKEYIDTVNSGKLPVVWEETEGLEDRMSEFMFLGLRCRDGISERDFKERFGCSVFDVYSRPIKKYMSQGFLLSEGGRLRLSDKSFFVSNTILADFV